MSTFNQFMQNDDNYTDLYTPLLYLEKGMKRGKEQFREFNRAIKQTSRKANEIGQKVQSQTDLIKQAMNKFVGDMNTINQIGKTINQKLGELQSKVSGSKRLESTQLSKHQSVQPQSTQNNDNQEAKDKKSDENDDLKKLNLQQIYSSSNPKNEISLKIK
ncbi:hypothetical protein ABPG72_018747 [Tetrahymena utriculariae]